MHFSEKIRNAIHLANQAHKKALRYGPPKVPYITHPLTVAIILARVRPNNENLITAGILHDTVEDSKGKNKVTLKDIRTIFGKEVAGLVASVTQDKSKSWEERKALCAERIYEMEADGMLLKAADMLANLNDLNDALNAYGDKALVNFSRGFEPMMKDYASRITAFEETWPENPLLAELKTVYKALERFL